MADPISIKDSDSSPNRSWIISKMVNHFKNVKVQIINKIRSCVWKYSYLLKTAMPTSSEELHVAIYQSAQVQSIPHWLES